MLKRTYSFFAVIILGCFLLNPAVVLGVEEEIAPVSQEASQTDVLQHDIHVEETHVGPLDTGTIKDSVVPDPAKEGKKVIGLFLKTMVAVCFSAVLLYLILFFVKKRYGNALIQFLKSREEPEELENLDLSTPNNRNDALKSFLNRTK